MHRSAQITVTLLALGLMLGGAAAQKAAAASPAAKLTTCKAVATALGFKVDGATVFCPTNEAFEEFAEDLGLKGANLDKQLLAAAASNPDVFRTVLSYHVTKGILPAAGLKDGQALTTLLAEKKPTLTVHKDKGTVELVHPEVEFEEAGDDHAGHAHAEEDEDEHEGHGHEEGTHADSVVAADLTFEGAYAAGKSKYIVHAIDHVMVPEAALPGLKKAQAAIAKSAAKPSAAAKPAAPAKPAAAAKPAVAAKPAGRKLM